jgi:FtsP/CotA-like multicopper oxidase with cupredoxin domain
MIIAVDGNYLRGPIPLERFELAPGNRLDLDITLPAAIARYPIIDRFLERRPNALAEIIADDAAPHTSLFASPARAKVPEWRSFAKTPLLAELHLDARRGGPLGIEWTINGVAYSAHDHSGAPTLTLLEGTWNRIRFRNNSARLHPIHIHGMFFRLLARDEGAISEPFFRDTVLIHAKEAIDIGVVPLDPGKWMMHCHILEHAEAGMMTTIEVKAAGVQRGAPSISATHE